MSRFILEGDAFFVLKNLQILAQNKKVVYQQESFTSGISFLNKPDYYVFFDMNKELSEHIINLPFIICNLDKNFDLRVDWVKRLKNNSEYKCFDPIPSTDFQSLKQIFTTAQFSQFLPVKKMPLKYKNSKQNYEWYDLSLIRDLLPYQEDNIFEELCESYFDIWLFTDALWSGDVSALKYISYINNSNFEDYFNRIRETIKDYAEVYQSDAKTFYQHCLLLESPLINNEFRFQKVKEKLHKIEKNKIPIILSLYDECLKNVRSGSNPKLELISLFFKYRDHVTQ
jgi:hypothetical protein